MPKQHSMSVTEFREHAKSERAKNDTATRSKYGNKHVKIGGHSFDSKKEAERFGLNKIRVKAKDLIRFDIHVRFPLIVNKILVCTYEADFVEYKPDGTKDIVDVKSDATRVIPLYKVKKKLMEACYGIKIKEV